MSAIRQTADCLIIDTPQFTITVPGVWRREKSAAAHVVYAGRLDAGSISTRFCVGGHLLLPNLSELERQEAFDELLSRQCSVETKVTNGEAEIRKFPVGNSDGLLTGGYVALQPDAARVVFSRTLCDNAKAFNFYYEQWGFAEEPDLKQLAIEFGHIMQSAGLKQPGLPKP